MKYIIMITIVIGLAASDFLTGLLKACVKNDVSSKTMRLGGIHKISEIIIMGVACGLEIGLSMLGKYYSEGAVAQKLAAVSGMVASLLVFLYILVMELISILENYAEINPEARWAKWIVKKLRVFQQKEEKENGSEDV